MKLILNFMWISLIMTIIFTILITISENDTEIAYKGHPFTYYYHTGEIKICVYLF